MRPRPAQQPKTAAGELSTAWKPYARHCLAPRTKRLPMMSHRWPFNNTAPRRFAHQTSDGQETNGVLTTLCSDKESLGARKTTTLSMVLTTLCSDKEPEGIAEILPEQHISF
jgi:hypothetical protein